MAVLGRQAILRAIDEGAITISPFTLENVGPASVDLTLASSFRVFRKVHEVVDVNEHTDYRDFTDKVELSVDEHILTDPHPYPNQHGHEAYRSEAALGLGQQNNDVQFNRPRPNALRLGLT